MKEWKKKLEKLRSGWDDEQSLLPANLTVDLEGNLSAIQIDIGQELAQAVKQGLPSAMAANKAFEAISLRWHNHRQVKNINSDSAKVRAITDNIGALRHLVDAQSDLFSSAVRKKFIIKLDAQIEIMQKQTELVEQQQKLERLQSDGKLSADQLAAKMVVAKYKQQLEKIRYDVASLEQLAEQGASPQALEDTIKSILENAPQTKPQSKPEKPDRVETFLRDYERLPDAKERLIKTHGEEEGLRLFQQLLDELERQNLDRQE